MAKVQVKSQTARSAALVVGKFFTKAVDLWKGADGVEHKATPKKWSLSFAIGDISDDNKIFILEPTMLSAEVSRETYKNFKAPVMTDCLYATKNGYFTEVKELKGFEIILREQADDGCGNDADDEE